MKLAVPSYGGACMPMSRGSFPGAPASEMPLLVGQRRAAAVQCRGAWASPTTSHCFT